MQSFGDETNKAPAGGVAPHITTKGAMQAIEFYKKAFGATEVYRQMAEDGERVMYCRLEINGGSIMLHDDFPEFNEGREAAEPAGVVLHLQVEDADAWWSRAVEAGAEIGFPLADQFWGDRYGHVKDPFGHTWSIGAPIKS
ncbi:MAG: VOC family protein [Pseudomonadota bacterium]